jgi:hypothetical protein
MGRERHKAEPRAHFNGAGAVAFGGMQVRRKFTFALAAGITFMMIGTVIPGGSAAIAGAGAPGHRAAGPAAVHRGGAGRRAAAPRGARLKRVRFAGYTLEVPAGWPVYRLDRDPGRCVRYDQHAVYLGRPGADQQCPAHLVGRTATISVQPGPAGGPVAGGPVAGGPVVNGTAAGGTAAAGPAAAGPAIATLPAGGTVTADQTGNLVHATLAESGLSITGTYSGSPGPVLSIIRSARPARAAARGQAMAPAAGTRPAAAAGPARHRPGRRRPHRARRHRARRPQRHRARRMQPSSPLHGFDSCAAPPVTVMRAFRRDFAAAAIYIGGAEQGCAEPNLTAGWVRTVTRLGYALMPTYVGPQAWCSGYSVRISPRRAAQQGRAAAADATASAQALGMGRGTPIYYDLEDYNGYKVQCRTSSLTFLDAWTRALHARGYLSGIYSSVTPGVAAVGAAIWMGGPPIAKPDSVWFGLWDARRNLSGLPWLLAAWWSGPHRTKQYLGSHRRTLGGDTMDIDSDWVYGDVYR